MPYEPGCAKVATRLVVTDRVLPVSAIYDIIAELKGMEIRISSATAGTQAALHATIVPISKASHKIYDCFHEVPAFV